MKKLILSSILLISCIAQVWADNPDEPCKKGIGMFIFGFQLGGLTSKDDVNYLNLDADIGVMLTPSVCAYTQFTTGYRMCTNDHTFKEYCNIGIGVGWQFYKTKRIGNIEWRNHVTGHIWGNWSNTEYKSMIRWNFPKWSKVSGLSLSLGYQYLDSHSYNVDSRGGLAMSFGFSF